jgi:hypothetical protein
LDARAAMGRCVPGTFCLLPRASLRGSKFILSPHAEAPFQFVGL